MLNEKSAKLLEEKIKDENFLKKILETENDEEVVSIIKNEGIDIDLQEVLKIKKMVIKNIENEDNEELSDSDLEEVSGGIVITVTTLIAGIAAGVGATATGAGFVHEWTRGRW